MAGGDENLLSGDFGGSCPRLLRKARKSRKEGNKIKIKIKSFNCLGYHSHFSFSLKSIKIL
jgi:hypothetical protein